MTPVSAADAGRRPRVMVVARHFPNRVTAGNMTYTDAIVSFLEEQDIDLQLVVLGDRFPNNEFVYRYGDAPHRLPYVSFRQGVRVGKMLMLTGLRPLIKNVSRRTVLALPARLSGAIKASYFKARQISTEDWFAPLDRDDLTHAVAQIRQFKPDHLVIDSFMLAEIVEALSPHDAVTHLIMHDLVSSRLASQARVTDSMPEYHAAAVAQHMTRLSDIEREELRRLALFDVILAIQRAEAQHVSERLPDKRVLYVPMPAISSKRAEGPSPLSRRCLFVGSSGAVNLQGVEWFLGEVWPLVLRQLPDAVVDICGTCCNYLTARHASVRLRGRVSDLEPYYRSADVCVVPLLAGSGMKIKLVEAMACGSACVTTTPGMQGLEEGADAAFLHADGATDFADAVVRLMRDEPTRDRLRGQAAAFVETQLSSAVVFDELRRAIFDSWRDGRSPAITGGTCWSTT